MARSISTRSQILSIETMLMLIFFSFFAGSFYYTFNSRSSTVNSLSEMRDLEKQVIQISELLIKTPGFPQNWNQTSVIQPGFFETEVCSFQKLENFFNMTYLDLIQTLNLASYNIFVNISSVYNYTTVINKTIGILPQNQVMASPINRFFIVEKNNIRIPVKMEMVVWR